MIHDSTENHVTTDVQRDPFTLTLYYQNVRGLCSKTAEILNMSSIVRQYDCIALSETWLNDNIYNAELFDPKIFTTFRCDRNFLSTQKKRGGGVLLALSNEFQAVQLDINYYSDKFSELYSIDILVVKITLKFHYLYVIVLYIPPTCKTNDYETLVDALLSLHCMYDSDILIVGDFNIPEFNECYNTCASTNNYVAIRNLANFFNLSQYNSILNVNNRTLDLVFCNKYCKINRAAEILTAEDNYHPALVIETVLPKLKKDKFPLKNLLDFNFKKANFPSLYEDLANVDWNFLDQCTDVNLALDLFYSKIYDIFAIHVPKKLTSSGNYPSWFNGQIIRDLKQKHKAWKKYKSSGAQADLEIFKRLRTNIKLSTEQARKAYILNIEENISRNPNNFWTYINSLKNNTSIPSSLNYENQIINTPQEIVDSFASFFSKSFTEYPVDIHSGPSTQNINSINITSVTHDEVIKSIKKLKPKMTMGLDSVPAFLIRDCSAVFALPLTIIFNLIFKTSYFPDKWKTSRICPVFKKGDKTDLINYRPITIICNFGKVFEIYLHSILSIHVSGMLTDQQHGFMTGRSTITNLVCKTQFICENLDLGSQVDVIYTDFSKAFDKLDHALLLNKCEKFGLSSSLIKLLASYLHNRSQLVQYRGFQSKTFLQLSGVPQGSVLGPLLFNMFVNDIVDNIDVGHLLYADDLKIFCQISTENDCVLLQKNLDNINAWCTVNNLDLNVSKCNVMSFSRSQNLLKYNYNLTGVILNRPNYIKDLGVFFDAKMSFKIHIEKTRISAYKSLGFVLRNSKHFININTHNMIYTSFVRSRLEYASVVWNPIYNVSIDTLENIQRKFLKTTVFILDGIYPPRGFPQELLLSRFKLPTLKLRRIFQAIYFLFKIVNNKVDCIGLTNLIQYRIPRLNARRNNIFHLPTPRTNLLTASPVFQMITSYQKIENSVDIFCCKRLSILNTVYKLE